MTQDELKQLDALLVKFGALVLNKPYAGKDADKKTDHLFRQLTLVRKYVNIETENK